VTNQEAVQRTIETYFGALSVLDAEAAANLFAPDGILHYPGVPSCEGREAIRQYYQAVVSACATLQLVADQVFIVANRAAVKFTLQVTARNGRAVRAEGIDTLDLDDDGLIRSLRVYYDPAPLRAALEV